MAPGSGWSGAQLAGDGVPSARPAEPEAFDAGDDQTIVVYRSEVSESELDQVAVYARIAAHAAARSEHGQRVVTMTAVPARMGRWLGVGVETRVVTQLVVTVVYATDAWPRDPAPGR